MTTTSHPPRLTVIAGLLQTGADGRTDSACRPQATTTERALAEALLGGGHQNPPADHAIAELLLLAAHSPTADGLATGLSQAFLLPDDSRCSLAREDRFAAFADLFGQLALHQLGDQAKVRAANLLARLLRHGR